MWVGQLIELTHAWALHGDGKHKLHHGRWVLITFGTHCLAWDKLNKVKWCTDIEECERYLQNMI